MQGLQGASDLYQQGGPQYYQGDTYANPTQGMLQGLSGTIETGLNGTNAQHQGEGALSSFLAPGFMNANPGNPTQQSAANGGLNVQSPTLDWFANGNSMSAENPYFKQMSDRVASQVLPSIQGQFNSGNRLNSGLASRAAGLGLGDAIGSLAYNNYQTGLGQKMQAGGMLADIGGQNSNRRLAGAQGLSSNYNTAAGQQLQGMSMVPAYNNMEFSNLGQATQAGGVQQGINQNIINDSMNRWNFNQQRPYQNLNDFIANVQGNVGKYGQQTSTQPYFTNPMANVMGGAMGLGALSNAGMFGSGGLGGMFSGMGAYNTPGSWSDFGYAY